MPFTATIRPARRAAAAASRAASSSSVVSSSRKAMPGPQAAHATGSAEAAAPWVLVLGATRRAEGEDSHRRPRAVVGKVADDGVAGAAVGAVDERVAVPPVRRIVHLPETGLAGGDVGRHDGAAGRAARALNDDELTVPARLERALLQPVDASEWRQLAPERPHEAADGIDLPLHLDPHAVRVVPHQPGETESSRHSIDRRPESHALDGAGDADTRAREWLGDGSTGHGPRPVRALVLAVKRPTHAASALPLAPDSVVCGTSVRTAARSRCRSRDTSGPGTFNAHGPAHTVSGLNQHLRPDVRGRRSLTVPA
jgi:hypothetical protein